MQSVSVVGRLHGDTTGGGVQPAPGGRAFFFFFACPFGQCGRAFFFSSCDCTRGQWAVGSDLISDYDVTEVEIFYFLSK